MESGADSKLNDNLVLPSSSISQNPFLVTNETANVGINHGSSSTHSSLGDDMLVGGNLFHEERSTDSKVPVEVFDTWQNQPTTYQIVPTNVVDSHNPFQVIASDIDSFLPKHEHNDDPVGQHSTTISPGFIIENGTKGLEIQNPPMQVMERSKESAATSSQYVFPSHVFARNTTNAPVEWSTASNESLFSIYMGNTSFSSEHPCFKSCELDINQANTTSPNNNQQPQPPVSKFNDISQRTAELHEENTKVTEAQAAETMREVIMENFQTEENVGKKTDKKFSSRHQSDGSANSYSFQISGDKDKSIGKSVGEKQKPQKQTEANEVANAHDQAQAQDQDQAPKSNAAPRRWLNCFSCCTLCR